MYAAVLGILLGVRLWDWARRLQKRRSSAPAAGVVSPRRALVLALLSVGLLAWANWPADAQALRVGHPAPEIAGGPWIGSPPLTLSGLKGRVVLVEFWTYG